jgi:hypothetical protein
LVALNRRVEIEHRKEGMGEPQPFGFGQSMSAAKPNRVHNASACAKRIVLHPLAYQIAHKSRVHRAGGICEADCGACFSRQVSLQLLIDRSKMGLASRLAVVCQLVRELMG